jgi:hypothetical protein
VPLSYNLVLGIQEFTLEFRDRKRFDPPKVSVVNFNLSESEAQPRAAKLQHGALLSSSLIRIGPATPTHKLLRRTMAVRLQLPTSAVRVRTQVRWTKCQWVLRFPLPIRIPPIAPHIIIHHLGLVQ